MKKILSAVIVSVVFLSLFSCAKKEGSGISAVEIMDSIKKEANFENPKEENLQSLDVAERYGIAVESIEEGLVYYDGNESNIDKVILAIAKDEDSLHKIETALANEKKRINDMWANEKSQESKLKDIVLKTRGRYVILIISQNPKAIERVFDELA